MKDRVPLYPGRVKLTPVSGQANTYDMVRADEPTQEGTPLSKAALLKDNTAALFGLGSDAVPDDAFNVLSRFQNGLGNEYVWSKNEIVQIPTGDTHSNPGQSTDLNALYYADTFTVSDNKFLLENAILFTYNGSNLDTLKGKYLTNRGSAAVEMRYIPETATLTYESGNTFSASQCIIYQNPRMENVLNVVGYVNSPSQNAYPPAVSDGYTYVALGQLGAKVRMATGSYTGTGTYGSSNPNRLTFGFKPKFFYIGIAQPFQFSGALKEYMSGIKEGSYYVAGWVSGTNYQTKEVKVSFLDDGIEWYSVETYETWYASVQLNRSGATYYYIAIG